MQNQADIFTETLAQKRGCLTFEPLEVVGAGLWLLSGQAVGVQSHLSSSGCSHRACFSGEVEEGQKSSAHLSAKMGSLGSL